MVRFYVTRIRLGKLTLADAQERWRVAVAAALEGGGQDG